MRTYVITVQIRIGENTDTLTTADAIEAEVTSWLGDLGADVRQVSVEEVES